MIQSASMNVRDLTIYDQMMQVKTASEPGSHRGSEQSSWLDGKSSSSDGVGPVLSDDPFDEV